MTLIPYPKILHIISPIPSIIKTRFGCIPPKNVLYTQTLPIMIEDKKSHARGLYFQTQLSQQEIADRVGVNRKTLYLWINEEKWQEARLAAAQSPTILLHQYYQQLININEFIAARTDSPFPTPKEADVIRKLSSVIKQLSTKVNLGTMVEVFNLFTDDFLRQGYSQQEAIAVRKYMDDFLKRRFHIHKKRTSTGLKYAQDDQIVAEYKEWEATYPTPATNKSEETPNAPQYEKNHIPAEMAKTEDKAQTINEVAQITNAPSVPHSPTVAAAPVTNLLTEPTDPQPYKRPSSGDTPPVARGVISTGVGTPPRPVTPPSTREPQIPTTPYVPPPYRPAYLDIQVIKRTRRNHW
jgi:DNA-binding XRE family transcriptional regulator